MASSRNHTDNRAIDNVDNYVREWWRVNMNDWVNEDDTPYIRMKAERDELIDDLSWYKAKVSRLEENNDRLTDGVKTLEIENANKLTLNWELKGYADMYKGDSDEYKTLLSEFSQHIGNKPSSSTYKYFRGKLNALEIREGE